MKHLSPLALICLCLLSACSKRAIKDLPPQDWQGYEVKVLSVEAKSSPYTQKLEIPSSTSPTCRAKEGSEVIVAEISFKPGPQVRWPSFSPIRLELEDAYGKKYETTAMPPLGPDIDDPEVDYPWKNKVWEFCFAVPKGAELKTLRVEDLTFDLR